MEKRQIQVIHEVDSLNRDGKLLSKDIKLTAESWSRVTALTKPNLRALPLLLEWHLLSCRFLTMSFRK